jgi:hypothetical protein
MSRQANWTCVSPHGPSFSPPLGPFSFLRTSGIASRCWSNAIETLLTMSAKRTPMKTSLQQRLLQAARDAFKAAQQAAPGPRRDKLLGQAHKAKALADAAARPKE